MEEGKIMRENMPGPGEVASRGEKPKAGIEAVRSALGESDPESLRQKRGRRGGSGSVPKRSREKSPAERAREAKEAKILAEDRKKGMEEVRKRDAPYIARLEKELAGVKPGSREAVAIQREINRVRAPLF